MNETVSIFGLKRVRLHSLTRAHVNFPSLFCPLTVCHLSLSFSSKAIWERIFRAYAFCICFHLFHLGSHRDCREWTNGNPPVNETRRNKIEILNKWHCHRYEMCTHTEIHTNSATAVWWNRVGFSAINTVAAAVVLAHGTTACRYSIQTIIWILIESFSHNMKISIIYSCISHFNWR